MNTLRPDMPQGPRCLVGNAGLICNDPTLPKGLQDYVVKFQDAVNYMATTPEMADALDDWAVRNCTK